MIFKKSIKILAIILILTILLSLVNYSSAASNDSDIVSVAMKDMSNSGLDTSGGNGKLANILNAVLKLIQIAGTGISMIMVTMLGIKYMLAAPSDKADVKKQILPLVIGAVILFAAVNLVNIIANIADKTLKEASDK